MMMTQMKNTPSRTQFGHAPRPSGMLVGTWKNVKKEC